MFSETLQEYKSYFLWTLQNLVSGKAETLAVYELLDLKKNTLSERWQPGSKLLGTLHTLGRVSLHCFFMERDLFPKGKWKITLMPIVHWFQTAALPKGFRKQIPGPHTLLSTPICVNPQLLHHLPPETTLREFWLKTSLGFQTQFTANSNCQGFAWKPLYAIQLFSGQKKNRSFN